MIEFALNNLFIPERKTSMNMLLFKYVGTSCAIALVRSDGMIWDFVQLKFVAMPANGEPTKDHIRPATKLSASGKYQYHWSCSLPIDPAVLTDTIAMVHPTTGTVDAPTILDVVDEYPYQWYQGYITGRGGWMRSGG